MTRSKADREKFIQLRASGMTLAQAAKKMHMAYNTAVDWQSQDKEQIDAAKAIQMDELMDEFRMTKERRLEIFGQQLLDMQKELNNRDLSDVPTPELMDMMIRLSQLLKSEAIEPKFMIEEDMEREKRRRQMYRSYGWPEDLPPTLVGKFIRQRLKEMDKALQRIGRQIRQNEKDIKKHKKFNP